jgi:hypothetical protein
VPFFEGEAGLVGPNRELVPGPVVVHSSALNPEEMLRLKVREVERYHELYAYIYLFVYVCMYILYACMYVCMCVCVCVYR